MDGAVSLWERYGTHHIILDHRVLPLRLATYYYCFTAALFQFIRITANNFAHWNGWWTFNVVLEKCSRWKFAEHDEQQYDDHQGKVANIDLEFSLSPQVQGILIAPCRPSTGAVIEQHTQIKRILPVCGNYSSDERTESVKQQVLFALTAAHLNICSPVTVLVLKSLGYR